MSSDPAMDGINWYGYVGGNALGAVDPLGLFCWTATMWPLIMADGPSPVGDIVYGVGVVVEATVLSIVKNKVDDKIDDIIKKKKDDFEKTYVESRGKQKNTPPDNSKVKNNPPFGKKKAKGKRKIDDDYKNTKGVPQGNWSKSTGTPKIRPMETGDTGGMGTPGSEPPKFVAEGAIAAVGFSLAAGSSIRSLVAEYEEDANNDVNRFKTKAQKVIESLKSDDNKSYLYNNDNARQSNRNDRSYFEYNKSSSEVNTNYYDNNSDNNIESSSKESGDNRGGTSGWQDNGDGTWTDPDGYIRNG